MEKIEHAFSERTCFILRKQARFRDWRKNTQATIQYRVRAGRCGQNHLGFHYPESNLD